MKIKIIAAGGKMPGWVQEGYNEYAKRLPRELTLEMVEIPLGNRGQKNSPALVEKARQKEGEAMLAAIQPREHVVALEVKGKSWSTEQLSRELAGWQMGGDNVCLLIGGPDGLAPECVARANQKWSLSALTMPHPLVRVLLAEQLYRAWTLLAGHPYHK
ncbi:23S rRNA (pseudouridine(1915)-N(3))-methyltransferase RlmH [Microbulbifer agarilyticus]|uniref:23S rRNA (pseudouridine(1915)-N(3))-methyltransferase RlmH n=1 Tax=Microbulbifer agarilyticus TaxID=260552 RepID=UPI001C95E690|nr:23S rRNA (pseudouridine(1915)-N(3))-methyltransferase RlmH [Microbulbifer agarilyticus]MBY6190591.1 23S rRNA (pseudouridine(1915)-N(3))-methyltransferase RlmH [Microbulbifer agarilyticus]MBY6210575.1 23S rRNA (pseudouridine(1915)-N(3))-methyltransferase RlmH [Microbulbifer agarilyticus]MCA0893057.1 23S rRNA (pseudouridine(1915)-N(3))-methyltransferase RlmH [Microbulbifer agarilyticus]